MSAREIKEQDMEAKTTTYRVDWSDGRSTECETYDEARDLIRARYPDAEIGHDGDLTERGDLTLAWRCDAEADGDAGQRAIAVIREVRS